MADHGEVDTDQVTYGPFAVYRVYYRGVPTNWRRVTAFAGTHIVVSFHDTPARVLSGADDAALTWWFATAPADKEITWSWDHEYDARARRHHDDPAAYRAGWLHLIDLAHAANPLLKNTLILTAYAFNHGSLDAWQAFYPGPQIDSISIDGYSWSPDRTTPPDVIFGKAIAAARSVGKPFAVAEVAALAPWDRPDLLVQWIYDLRDYLEANHALFVAWFNVNFADPSAWGSWRLTQDPTIAAYRQVLHPPIGPQRPPPPDPGPCGCYLWPAVPAVCPPMDPPATGYPGLAVGVPIPAMAAW